MGIDIYEEERKIDQLTGEMYNDTRKPDKQKGKNKLEYSYE